MEARPARAKRWSHPTKAELPARLAGSRVQRKIEHERWLVALGNGGYLAWSSSPFVMWLAQQLDKARA